MTNGADFSHWDPPTDWARVGEACDFVICKATQGAGGVDPTFATSRAQMLAHVKVQGAYHFAVPGDPIAQARHFFSVAGRLPILALDLEEEDSAKGLTWRSRHADPQAFATAFLGELDRLSGAAWIYTGPGFINEYRINQTAYPLWLAQYGPVAHPAPWPRESIWQYSDHGTVPGCPKPCDVNRSDLTVAQLLALAGQPPEVEMLDPNDPTVKALLADLQAVKVTQVKQVAAQAATDDKVDRLLASNTRIEADLAKPAGQ